MIRALVVGLGNMGYSHALAYYNHPEVEIVGLVSRSQSKVKAPLQNYPHFTDFTHALATTSPNLVCIATYSDTHADYAIKAMQAGAHVFVEKPLAETVERAQAVVDVAAQTQRKLMVGYILRQHPSWQQLIKSSRELGGPYVFRLNLNQQSTGVMWATHKSLMQSTSPIVDCGVHYVDVMCQITDAKPVKVHGMGLRLSHEIAEDMYNYGHFQVTFADESIGWYEAGWGPMMSETAYFVKDIVSPNGAVSILNEETKSDDVDGHTRVGALKVHDIRTGDSLLELPPDPGHQGLCNAEQAAMIDAIQQDADLTRHMQDAVQSLRICLAADESIRTGETVYLD